MGRLHREATFELDLDFGHFFKTRGKRGKAGQAFGGRQEIWGRGSYWGQAGLKGSVTSGSRIWGGGRSDQIEMQV